MPGWHDATEELQEAGRFQMVGIIEEQHPDRCALFMQWKEMGWPILVDSLNLLEMDLVPLTLAIDEHGIIRHRGLRVADAERIEELFLERENPAPAKPHGPLEVEPSDLARLAREVERDPSTESFHRYANALVLWGGPQRLDDAIDAYGRALEGNPGDGWVHFRLGVAHRLRYDSPHRRPEDFQRAVEEWSEALRIDPNNYIWRRRIQQYGPRLDKPYPFYDWVETARREIAARGETPVSLIVEPSRSELAAPVRSFPGSTAGGGEPDPKGRIHRDPARFVEIETAVVPPRIAPGESARLHLLFRPNEEIEAHWNNEVDELAVWIEPPPGWELDRQILTHPNPPTVVSRETRALELELKAPGNAETGPGQIRGYSLYYVCEDVDGTCLYRRQDFGVDVAIVDSTP